MNSFFIKCVFCSSPLAIYSLCLGSMSMGCWLYISSSYFHVWKLSIQLTSSNLHRPDGCHIPDGVCAFYIHITQRKSAIQSCRYCYCRFCFALLLLLLLELHNNYIQRSFFMSSI